MPIQSLHLISDKIAHIIGSKGQNVQITRARLVILQCFCLVLFAVLAIRLGDIMVIQPPTSLNQEAQNQKTQEPLLSRADIFDRNGVLLATSLDVSSLYADPTLVTDKTFIGARLAEILDIDDPTHKLSKKGRFVWIKRGITPEEQYQINALGAPGLGFKTEQRRFYPHGHLAAHILGYTSVDGGGLAGLERQYNDILSKESKALHLSMDVRVQYSLLNALENAKKRFKAKGAIGGVVDVTNGEILAAVSLPDFDPHHVGKASDDMRFNRFAHGVYEMGSTFKLFSTANFIEQTGKPFSYQFDARKPLKEGRFTINDFHAQKRVLNLPEVFIHSSNIGSAMMGRQAGTQAMKAFYTDLGFMDRLNADFPALGKPLTPSPWRDINTLTASYGHGIAVTPLHVLQAAASVVNGGIVKPITFTKTKTTAPSDLIETRVLSAATSHKMRQLLRLNVTHGSGEKADIQGYLVGGKTGTSEKATASGYDADRLLSSFLGVFPASAPRYAILAILDEPQGRKDTYGYATGGWTAAPVIGAVINDMADILAIPAQDDDGKLTAGLDRYLKDQDDARFTPAVIRH